MANSSTATPPGLTPADLERIARLFMVKLEAVSDPGASFGAIRVTDIATGSLLEQMLTREWLDARIGSAMNEATLVWLDQDKGWQSYRIGPAMAATARVLALHHTGDTATPDSVVSIGTRVEKNIYLFFQTRDGPWPTLSLVHPAASAFFADDINTWPESARASYLKTLLVTETAPKATEPAPVKLVLPRTPTSDLLFRMYEIACCNDPGQPILPRVAVHLEAFGYDLSDC